MLTGDLIWQVNDAILIAKNFSLFLQINKITCGNSDLWSDNC
jgi:hypothetical protein